MRSSFRYGLVGAFLVVAFAQGATAAVSVHCDISPTTALGNALATNNTPGTVFAITGMCQQSVQLTLNVVTTAPIPSNVIILTNSFGSPTASFNPGDGIEGQVTISGATTALLNGISLAGTDTDTGLTSNVLVELGASAVISNSHIDNGQRIGVLVIGSASAAITNTFIEGNGVAGIAGQNDGLRVADGSTALLGTVNNDGSINTAAAAVVDSNTGNGISVVGGSRLVIAGGGVGASGSIEAVTPNSGDQIFLAGGSVAGLYDVQVSQTPFTASPSGFTIEEEGASALLLADATSVDPGIDSGGIAVRATSSLTMNGATVFGTGSNPALTVIEATGNSNVILAGGNTIGGNYGATTFQIDHSSSLVQMRPGGLLPAISGVPIAGSTAAESISGPGLIQEQSSVDLGQGLVASSPSLTWTGSITAAQNSSFRLSGGVHITGSVQLSQGSNGFFNLANGGANNVDGGVTCRFSSVAAAHVTGANSVVPNVATSAAPTSPKCLPF